MDSLIGPQKFIVGYSKAPKQPQSSARPICHSHAMTSTGRKPATTRIAASELRTAPQETKISLQSSEQISEPLSYYWSPALLLFKQVNVNISHCKYSIIVQCQLQVGNIHVQKPADNALLQGYYNQTHDELITGHVTAEGWHSSQRTPIISASWDGILHTGHHLYLLSEMAFFTEDTNYICWQRWHSSHRTPIISTGRGGILHRGHQLYLLVELAFFTQDTNYICWKRLHSSHRTPIISAGRDGILHTGHQLYLLAELAFFTEDTNYICWKRLHSSHRTPIISAGRDGILHTGHQLYLLEEMAFLTQDTNYICWQRWHGSVLQELRV